MTGYTIDVAPPGAPPLTLYAQERGQGPTVVLLHGLGGSTYSWRYVAPVLARTHRVIALDLKGFGRSSKVFDTAYSATDQARLVATFLARRRLDHVTLVGHSFGGQVALLTAIMLARRDPSRIDQLALIDVPALPQPLTPLVAFMQQPVLPYALLTVVPPDVVTRLAVELSPGAALERRYTEADVHAYAEPFRDAAARHAYVQTSRQIAPSNLDSIVRRYRFVRQRTLLVWCADDQVVPLATGQALVRMLPHARLDQISGCNHAPPDEAPAALTRSLLRFLTH
jgi:pimeloyl-ACP methyl ester carboxylesterase